VTELACALATGRTHQIRVHLASIGHPVLGDDRYGGGRPSPVPLTRPWLHAEHLGFYHPVTADRIELSSPLPEDLAAALGRFPE
jgi:23S rRNA pseudouridine1911/1915/1917 synthase